MFKVPRKIIEVDLYDMEARFLAHYLELYGCDNLTDLENSLKES